MAFHRSASKFVAVQGIDEGSFDAFRDATPLIGRAVRAGCGLEVVLMLVNVHVHMIFNSSDCFSFGILHCFSVSVFGACVGMLFDMVVKSGGETLGSNVASDGHGGTAKIEC